MLSHDNSVVRRNAVLALSDLGDKRALEPLISLLKIELSQTVIFAQICCEIIIAIGNINDIRGLKILKEQEAIMIDDALYHGRYAEANYYGKGRYKIVPHLVYQTIIDQIKIINDTISDPEIKPNKCTYCHRLYDKLYICPYCYDQFCEKHVNKHDCKEQLRKSFGSSHPSEIPRDQHTTSPVKPIDTESRNYTSRIKPTISHRHFSYNFVKIGVILGISIGIVLLLGVYVISVFSSNNNTISPASVDNQFGTISGNAYDQNVVGIPYARVTLWQNGKIVNIPGNPQLTNNGMTNSVGKYSFSSVPYGSYTLSVESEGHWGSTIIKLDSDESYSNTVIPNYAYMPSYIPPGSPTITPTLGIPVYNSNYDQPISYGNIIGNVHDTNDNGEPYANVTLWQDGKIVNIPENPQQTNDGRTSTIGNYNFMEVPPGNYIITADKDGKKGSVSVDFNSNSETIDIVIS